MRQAAELSLSREVLGAIARQARDKARLSDDGLLVDTDGPGNTVGRGGGGRSEVELPSNCRTLVSFPIGTLMRPSLSIPAGGPVPAPERGGDPLWQRPLGHVRHVGARGRRDPLPEGMGGLHLGKGRRGRGRARGEALIASTGSHTITLHGST